MPLPIMLAHGLTRKLAEIRKKNILSYLGSDGKSQVSIEYHDEVPKRASAIVISTQHREDISLEQLRRDVLEQVIKPVCGKWLDNDTKYFINPTGRFVIGGPQGDSGLTGRKIIVDTYGGVGRHGGGAFSGKDSSKVDRSAAYAARWVAKNVVAAGHATRCEVQISYAIGVAQPTSVHIDTFGTNTIPEDEIRKRVLREFDLRPKAIIDALKLKRPIYKQFAAYGHFGRKGTPWEDTSVSSKLKH
jgi:S-adenosylmethionine synthetase